MARSGFSSILLIACSHGPASSAAPCACEGTQRRDAPRPPRRPDLSALLGGVHLRVFLASHSKMVPYILACLAAFGRSRRNDLVGHGNIRPRWMRCSMPAALALSLLLGVVFHAARMGKISGLFRCGYFSLPLLAFSAVTLLSACTAFSAWARHEPGARLGCHRSFSAWHCWPASCRRHRNSPKGVPPGPSRTTSGACGA